MKRILTVAVIIILTLTGCSDGGYKKITTAQAKEIMENEQVIVLDVRTEEEFREGHIENAILLPNVEITLKAEEMLTDKDAKILVYCRSGRRSEAAARDLLEMGYKNVYDFGGLNEWEYETVR